MKVTARWNGPESWFRSTVLKFCMVELPELCQDWSQLILKSREKSDVQPCWDNWSQAKISISKQNIFCSPLSLLVKTKCAFLFSFQSTIKEKCALIEKIWGFDKEPTKKSETHVFRICTYNTKKNTAIK